MRRERLRWEEPTEDTASQLCRGAIGQEDDYTHVGIRRPMPQGTPIAELVERAIVKKKKNEVMEVKNEFSRFAEASQTEHSSRLGPSPTSKGDEASTSTTVPIPSAPGLGLIPPTDEPAPEQYVFEAH